MSQEEICFLPLEEQAKRIRMHDLSPRELTEAYLQRIADLDPVYRTMVTVTAERARADANKAEGEIAHGRNRGQLHGIPITLKDVFDTAGIPTTACSRILRERTPPRDSVVASALRNSGAVLLGKASMHEFAMGAVTDDDFVPPARNPWNVQRQSGGSSSGSAAGVAACFCSAGVASDTGGSARTPASFCGVVGFKPTLGLVATEGMIPLSWSLDHAGIICRTAGDVRLVLGALARLPPAPEGPLRGTRLGVPWRLLDAVSPREPAVERAFETALDVVRELGLEIHEVELPPLAELESVLLCVQRVEAAASHEVWLRERSEEIGVGFRIAALPGFAFSGVEYVQAQRTRALLTRTLEGLLTSDVDVIATPTLPWVAPPVGSDRPLRGPFTGIFNLTGQPSISIQCGSDGAGMPIGLMLSSARSRDHVLLRIAGAYQNATPWHLRHPPIPTPN